MTTTHDPSPPGVRRRRRRSHSPVRPAPGAVREHVETCRDALRSSGRQAAARLELPNPQVTGGATTPLHPRAPRRSIHRYFDPATGQFMSVDPCVLQTGEPYEFAGANPVNMADPAGLQAVAAGTQGYSFPNPYGCLAYIGDAHYSSGSNETIVKVNGAILGCTLKPQNGEIDVQLYKTGAEWYDSYYFQGDNDCRSSNRGYRPDGDCKWYSNVKNRFQLWNNSTAITGQRRSGDNTAFYGLARAGVEIAGTWYYTPSWPIFSGVSLHTWTALGFWTPNSP